MKRLLVLVAAGFVAAASLVLAQPSEQGTLKAPTGDHPIAYRVQSGQTYVSAVDVVAGLGGTVEPDSTGFKVTIGNAIAAFGPDSRYGVIRDDLIEMPAPPIVVDGRPFVPWQFFQGLLSRTASLDAAWDTATHTLIVRSPQHDVVGVQVSVANVQGITKTVVTLSGPAEYTIARQPGFYAIRFKTSIRAPFGEQAYEDPYVSAIAFSGNELRIRLSSIDIAGDAYRLESPPRIVLDLRKTGGATTGSAPAPVPLRPQRQPGIRTIVIDPGHGGKEVGAIGPGGLMEKDITLALSRRLAAALASKVGARVILTREDDSVVSLDQRTAIANQFEADLFLSVHMNAAAGKDAKGSETYFLSLEASDELARNAAEIENASAVPDPDVDLKLILWDLAQQAYLDESSRFAQAIQEELNAATAVENRGVKQAPFKVLVGATMPAALVEVAFISNADEEAKLKSEAFQRMMVDAIASAVQKYKTDYEVRIGVAQRPAPATPPPATTPPPPAPAHGADAGAPSTGRE